MRLVIHSQYYVPEMGAVPNRLSDLARRLKARKHRVTVLAALPNNPTGKIYPGYGGLIQRAEYDGIPVIHTFIVPTVKTDTKRRLLSYFSFVFSSAFFGTFLIGRPDYLMVQSPPFFVGIAAYWLSRIKRVRLIVNVSDLWPDSAVELGMLRRDSLSYKLSAWLEAFYYRKAWLITGQSKSILESIEQRFPGRHTFPLFNGVDIERFGAEKQTPETHAMLREGGDPQDCIALYAGLHGVAQGLDQVLSAAQMLKSEGGLRFILIGDGAEKPALVEQAQQNDLSNVSLRDPVPSAQVPPLLASSDILLVPLKSYIRGAVPSKLYEAMASGRPVVLVAAGEAADIVREHKAGLVVEPGDIEGLAQAIRQLRDDPALRQELGTNGRRAAEQHFNRECIVARFIDHLEENL